MQMLNSLFFQKIIQPVKDFTWQPLTVSDVWDEDSQAAHAISLNRRHGDLQHKQKCHKNNNSLM